MHDGRAPVLQLNAVWEAPDAPRAPGIRKTAASDQAELLKAMLGRLNICSKRIPDRASTTMK